jgi:lysophospholipase L1-like esterase
VEPGVIIRMLIAALAAAAPLPLVVAEAGCRWWLRRRSHYYVWPPWMRLEIRPDPEAFPDLERRVRFDINADGERGGEARDGEAGLYRILAAGGSAVECFALDQPTSWPGALERLLNNEASLDALGARRVHVGNIGHSGVGSADLDLILERVLPQYGRLDTILIMVGASDVYHWLEDGAPPSRAPAPVPELMLFSCHPQQPFGWKPSAWALAEIARRLRRSWLRRLEIKERAGTWYATARRMRAEAKEVRTATPDPAVMLHHFDHHFRRLLRRALSHADRVLVVCQPWFEGPYTAEETAHFWHGGIGKPWKETVSVYHSLEVINQLLDLVHARTATVADEFGVPHLNLRPVLTLRLRHYFDHDHYTPAGAAVVAQAIAAALLERLASPERRFQPALSAVATTSPGSPGPVFRPPARGGA